MHFKELLTTEVQIKRVNKYWPEEISVWVITHPDDYTLAMERIFFESKASWKTYRMVLLEEVEDEPEPIPIEQLPPEPSKKERDPIAVKRQQLVMNIKNLAPQIKKTEEEIVQAIYDKYKITSRMALTESELDREIKLHRPFTPEELAQDNTNHK